MELLFIWFVFFVSKTTNEMSKKDLWFVSFFNKEWFSAKKMNWTVWFSVILQETLLLGVVLFFLFIKSLFCCQIQIRIQIQVQIQVQIRIHIRIQVHIQIRVRIQIRVSREYSFDQKWSRTSIYFLKLYDI